MSQNPYAASTTAVPAEASVDIDQLDVSDRWKQYFKAVQAVGGLRMPAIKALPKEEQKEAMKKAAPPISSFALAFVFGFFYYLAKGMWKKGLVLLGITLVLLTVLSVVLHMFGADAMANGLRFVAGGIFGVMAPRDFYAFKVLGDKGWLPVRPV